MSRLDFNPTIVNMVAELERRYEEIKQAQVVGGDVVKTFMATGPHAGVGTWDFSTYIDNNTAAEVIVTFTPDDTTGTATAGVYEWQWLANQSGVSVVRIPVTNFAQQQFRISIWGLDSTARLIFWVFSTGKGTLSFERTI